MAVKVPSTTQWQDLASKVNSKSPIIGVTSTPGNVKTFTVDIPMLTGKSDAFFHNFVVFCYTNAIPSGYICTWTKSRETLKAQEIVSNNTTLTLTLNSTNETTGRANITLTFSRTVYGGIRVLAIV